MLKSLALATVCVHLISCFWYTGAKLNEFSPLTWVVRRQLQDASTAYKYAQSVYWAC